MKVGVALSGGFVKGAAHIGFLRALEEKGIVPSVVAGSSAGALVGALYCSGYSPEEILNLAKETRWRDLATLSLKGGFFKLSGLKEKLLQLIGNVSFKELKIPLVVTVVNLETLKLEFINEGPVVDFVVASCSIPPLFSPVKVGNYYYGDGGIRNCLPSEAPKVLGCSLTICSNANTLSRERFNPHSMVDVSLRASLASVIENQETRFKYCDIVVSYNFKHSQFNFSKVEAFYKVGYDKAKEKLKEVEKWL